MEALLSGYSEEIMSAILDVSKVDAIIMKNN